MRLSAHAGICFPVPRYLLTAIEPRHVLFRVCAEALFFQFAHAYRLHLVLR
jgi:hypothetical protein